jgi:LCP family protein required for cell wall assembly
MDDAAQRASLGPHHPRPWLAALLSFVFPGLGQAYAGQRRLALLLALPVVLLLGAAVAALNGAGELRNSLFSSGFLAAVVALNVALFGWRTFAIAHAGLAAPAREPRARRIALAVVGILVMVAVGMHVWVGVVAAHLDDTLRQVFGGTTVVAAPDPSAAPGAGTDEGDGEAPDTATPYQWDGTERVNILLLGTDAHRTRDAVLTDVVLVVSIDPASGTAAMISVPRDTGFVPLPDERVYPDGLFPGKVNELMLTASLDPARWCPDLAGDPEGCGLRTIERTVGLYLGLEIHHYALVDMAGFAEMIDALGGLRLCLPGELHDPQFDGTLANRGDGGLVLPAGCHEYDGIEALAYARSRQGWIEMPDGTRVDQSDFARNERQQSLLLALRSELAEADLIFELPAVLQAIGRTIRTDVPRDRAGDLASLLPLITGPDIDRIVLGYPEFVDAPSQPDLNYMLIPRRDAVREEMAQLLGRDELVGWYMATDAESPSAAEAEAAPAP